MRCEEPPAPAREDRCDKKVLRAQQDDIAQLLEVVESHLVLVAMGEPFDGRVLLDALDHLTEYARDVSACHPAVHTRGVELHRRLARMLQGDAIDRLELIRLGYAQCAELRHLSTMEGGVASTPTEQQRTRDDARYRAMFEASTRRVGCDCDYEDS